MSQPTYTHREHKAWLCTLDPVMLRARRDIARGEEPARTTVRQRAGAVRLLPSLLAVSAAVASARKHAARRSIPGRYAHPTAGFCDGCSLPRLDVRDCGKDSDGHPDAPSLCPVCRQALKI